MRFCCFFFQLTESILIISVLVPFCGSIYRQFFGCCAVYNTLKVPARRCGFKIEREINVDHTVRMFQFTLTQASPPLPPPPSPPPPSPPPSNHEERDPARRITCLRKRASQGRAIEKSRGESQLFAIPSQLSRWLGETVRISPYWWFQLIRAISLVIQTTSNGVNVKKPCP